MGPLGILQRPGRSAAPAYKKDSPGGLFRQHMPRKACFSLFLRFIRFVRVNGLHLAKAL